MLIGLGGLLVGALLAGCVAAYQLKRGRIRVGELEARLRIEAGSNEYFFGRARELLARVESLEGLLRLERENKTAGKSIPGGLHDEKRTTDGGNDAA